jgi:glucose uptake protein
VLIITSYPTAVFLCVITMLCWGSWANMQKLSSKSWAFQLFYWDYAIGILLLALILAFTAGSTGTSGRGFIADVQQAQTGWIGSALLGGVIFNLANILLVAAIDIAGMAVAFPVGIGLALVLGVITTYWAKPEGNVPMLAGGVVCVLIAIILNAVAYRRMSAGRSKEALDVTVDPQSEPVSSASPGKGIVLSLACGALMGFFYKFVAQSMGQIDATTGALEIGKLSPYTAVVFFSIGLLLSSFLWNTIVMFKPFAGPPVSYGDYFRLGTPKLHLVGIVGGMIWSLGFALNILANNAAGAALSYGLGQNATLVAALWGVFIWKEFKGAPKGTSGILAAMFLFFIIGLVVLIASKM